MWPQAAGVLAPELWAEVKAICIRYNVPQNYNRIGKRGIWEERPGKGQNLKNES